MNRLGDKIRLMKNPGTGWTKVKDLSAVNPYETDVAFTDRLVRANSPW